MEHDESILEEFVVEAHEHLETIEDDFLKLLQQKDDPDRELIDKVFRSIHSVKGGAGFLQLTQMSKLAHVMETLLTTMRADEIKIETEVIDELIAGVDVLNMMLKDPAASNDFDISDIYRRLNELVEGKASEDVKEDIHSDVKLLDNAGNDTGFAVSRHTLKTLPKEHKHIYVLKYDLTEFTKEKGRTPVSLVRELLNTGSIIDSKLSVSSDDLSVGLPKGPIQFEVLYSTILDPNVIDYGVGLPKENIVILNKAKLLSASSAKEEPEPQQPAQAAGDMDLPITKEMVDQFVAEADEFLEQTENALLEIADHPEKSKDNLAEAFRLIHSFKGNSGLFGFKEFEDLSHKMETVLEVFKMRESGPDESGMTLLLKGVDSLKEGISVLSERGETFVAGMKELAEELGILVRPGDRAGDIKSRPRGEAPKAEPSAAEKSVMKGVERRDIRVDLEKLDVLINLVGELVIAESMVTRNRELTDLELESFDRASHNLRRIIADLQDVAMAVRMIPLSRTFRKMIRLVHDLSRKAGKQISLELIGEDTEVDKTVIELIADPLVHIIRNSVDHGVEPPDERREAGKSPTGTVTIEAKHEGGEILIRVSDDGRGLSREKILKKGIERGLVSGDGSHLTDEEVYKLIFEPGFSTADQVSDVSGRGVGMDVVKRNLEKMKGRVDVKSVPGKGATVNLKIPLTLAIIDGMLIRVGAARYTIPLLSIRESFRPDLQQVTMTMDGQETVLVRRDLIPVVRLHELYATNPDCEALDKGILIMVGAGNRNVCLFADEIIGHHQTVIKAIPDFIGSARGISGCTILGDGEVSLILDVVGILDMAEKRAHGAKQQ